MKFKQLYILSFLVVCSLLLQGCWFMFTDSYKEKYNVINAAIESLIKKQGSDFILNETDTIHFSRIVVDMNCRPQFSVISQRNSALIYLDGLSNEYLFFNRHFENSELKHVQNQMKNSRLKFLDKNKINQQEILIDYGKILPNSIYNNVDLDLWNAFQNPEYDYCSLSDPLINSSRDKAIIGAVICVSDYFVRKVIHLRRDSVSSVWIVDNEYYIVGKVIQDKDSGSGKLVLVGSYVGEVRGKRKK